jgi:hypothetical protein
MSLSSVEKSVPGANAAAPATTKAVSQRRQRKIDLLEADVVLRLRDAQLGAGPVAQVAHHHLERRPDAAHLLEGTHVELLRDLVAPVVVLRRDDDEELLEDERDDPRVGGVHVLRA